MLSGFFGLIAIETSAGLRAEGSVIRTTCCAKIDGPNKTRQIAVTKQFFIEVCRINKIYRICLQLFHKERTEFVKNPRVVAVSPRILEEIMAKAKQSKKSGSEATTDHEEIRRWVEERGGHPARVNDTNLLRIDYPGFSGKETLETISWDEFFEVFDENNLAFLYQEETKDGGESRFSKFVDRNSVEE